MKTIAFAMQKGGVGKSTLTIHLAVELSRTHKVSIIDLDPQGTILKWKSRREEGQPHVLTSETSKLAAHLEKLRNEGMEYVFLDLPGRAAPTVNEGMRLADLVLIPARPLDIDIEASGETIATAQRLKRRYAFIMNVVSHLGKRSRQFAAKLNEHSQPVLSVHVTDRVAYPDAIAEGLGICEYDPSSKASLEIAGLKDAIITFLKE